MPKRSHRGGFTLAETLVAIAILGVLVVFMSADLTNVVSIDKQTDRSLETEAANFLVGVMQSDTGFWNNGNDWNTGPGTPCFSVLGPYTDTGPSPSPTWHVMPATQGIGCAPMPFSGQGGPQTGYTGPAVGNTVEYMWNASKHGDDASAADLTVWVRRVDLSSSSPDENANAPIAVVHAVRYQYPNLNSPSPYGTATPTPTPGPSPTPTPSPQPSTSPKPKPSPSPTAVGV